MSNFIVITELFAPTKGGTAVWFDEVYRRIGDHRTHIVTAAVPGTDEYDRNHPNTIHRLNLKRTRWLKPESLGMYLKLFARSLRLAITNRASAIHAGRGLPEGLVAWVVARMTSRPVVVYAHGEELTSWGSGAKFRALVFTLKHADQVIANSDYTRGELLRLGVEASRICLINPGVDTERFRPELETDDLRQRIGLKAEQVLLLSVGRLSRRKGFDEVIRCLPELRRQGFDVHYAIAGIGEDREYLAALAIEHCVEDCVHLLGSVSADELPRWYNACDVFVMPNRDINGDTEGFGMVFMEAAACGKPAIAGIAGGTGSAVLDGITGIRVDACAPGELGRAILRIAGDPALAADMGKRACIRARAEFAWPTVAERVRAASRLIVRGE